MAREIKSKPAPDGESPRPGLGIGYYADGCVSIRLTAPDGSFLEQMMTPPERDALIRALMKKPERTGEP